ncbi:MAG: aminotransferase class I/II-fold pyridoxal phosphate-dependent enzyme [Nitrosopumilus sp.]
MRKLASNHKLDFIKNELDQIKKNNLYRKIRFGKISGSKINIAGKNLINLSSNDYLGINPTNLKIKQIQSSSRLISGNDTSYEKFEKKLAKHKSHEKSLIFPTGYMANLGIISALVKKEDLILSDELNHASIIESCRLTGAKIEIFNHNDIKDLTKKIKQKHKRKFLITEGVFSMDGDYSNLQEITEISEKNNIITILDDAHGDFVIGKDGKGTPEKFHVSKKIDVYVSSLSKGLGSFGGYVASNNQIIDYCTNKSKSFIYTSALPAVLVEDAEKRFDSDRKKQQKKLQNNTKIIIDGLKNMGFQIESSTHIIPIIIGDEKKALDMGEFLFKNGVFVQPIRYPTVRKHQARLRISVSAWLNENDLEQALQVFKKAKKQF